MLHMPISLQILSYNKLVASKTTPKQKRHIPACCSFLPFLYWSVESLVPCCKTHLNTHFLCELCQAMTTVICAAEVLVWLVQYYCILKWSCGVCCACVDTTDSGSVGKDAGGVIQGNIVFLSTFIYPLIQHFKNFTSILLLVNHCRCITTGGLHWQMLREDRIRCLISPWEVSWSATNFCVEKRGQKQSKSLGEIEFSVSGKEKN